ncbi:MAG TPA: aminoglycoside phosphotransferase family protein [Streptosporangiaceae bacterium]
MGTLALPRNLVDPAGRDGWTAWLAATLPAAVAHAAEQWSITIGAPFQPGGQTAWVAPVRHESGADLVLKVMWPHPEGAHEADGLRAWAGHGAVLLRDALALAGAVALLMERCVPGFPLSRRPEPEQDVIIAELLRRLWIRPAGAHPFQSLQAMCEQWADRFEQQTAPGLDPGLARAGIALLRELPASAGHQVLLCTDLHAGNVLAATRQPWLAIDPKPYVGDPAYDVLQHMLNCSDRLTADPQALARRMAGLLDLDPARVLLWLFARCVQESPGWPGLGEVARRIAPA